MLPRTVKRVTVIWVVHQSRPREVEYRGHVFTNSLWYLAGALVNTRVWNNPKATSVFTDNNKDNYSWVLSDVTGQLALKKPGPLVMIDTCTGCMTSSQSLFVDRWYPHPVLSLFLDLCVTYKTLSLTMGEADLSQISLTTRHCPACLSLSLWLLFSNSEVGDVTCACECVCNWREL